MHRARIRPLPAVAMLVAASLALACSDDGRTLISPAGSLDAAKGGGNTGVSVTAATPSFGTPGTINETVTITGSGFESGAQASWLFLNDSVDTTITVVSTSFVSSTAVTSTISISPNSRIALRNIRVTNADRTKGIGNAVFEVTQAIPAPDAAIFRAVNDNGEFTGGAGTGTAFWSTASGGITVNGDGAQGFAVSPMGDAIVANNFPRVYTRPGPAGTPWQLTMLPVDPRATGGGAWALLADPTTGQPLVVGGRTSIQLSKKSGYEQPLIWTWQAGSGAWQIHTLPIGSGVAGAGSVIAISADTTAIGWLGGTQSCCYPGTSSIAAVWRADDGGTWHVTSIGPLGSGAIAINPAGTMIVGVSGGMAVYWRRAPDGTWGSPIALPGGCTRAVGIDVAARILVIGCNSSTAEPAAVMTPPYSASNMQFLGGLGPKNAAFVAGMSPSGQYVAGAAGATAAYWKIY